MTATLTTHEPAPQRALSVDLHRESTPLRLLLSELWRARELLVIMSRKEFHVRYRRASFGALWAVGLPLLQAVVIAIVFSRVTRFHNAPHYSMFVISGMVPWIYFNSVVSAGSTAIVDNADLSSKTYFPRLILPLVQAGSGLYALGISTVIALVLCPILHVSLGIHTLLVLPAFALLVMLACGVVLVASALHVYFRDVKYIVAAALLVWMYVTPLIYPEIDAPHVLRTIIQINPTTGVLDLFHAATVGQAGSLVFPVLVTVGWAVAFLVLGLGLQCRYNRVFTDLL